MCDINILSRRQRQSANNGALVSKRMYGTSKAANNFYIRTKNCKRTYYYVFVCVQTLDTTECK